MAGSIAPPRGKARSLRSVFIIGFSRSGKSALTQILRQTHGFAVFQLDRLRSQTRYSDVAIRTAFYELLLKLYPRGLVIEGDNLFGENSSRSSLNSESTFQNAVKGLLAKDTEVISIGNAEAGIDEKTSAILTFRENNPCWTLKANYSVDQIRDLARRSIAYSKNLRESAEALGVTYLEIRPSHFTTDLQNGANNILTQLG